MQPITVLAAAATGIVMQELIQWYSLRSRLSEEEHKRTLRDASYWMVVLAMLVIGSLATYFWMADELDRYKTRDALLLGISFPAIVRKAIAATVPDTRDPALGVRWTTYLR